MAQCTALACPRLHADPEDRTMAIDFSSSLVTRDALGNTWCNYCIKQCELINWGKAHNWPEIHVTGERGRYAIAQGQWHWLTSVMGSNQDAIDAYHAAVIAGNEAMEQEIAESVERAHDARLQARRERWLHTR
jgi:hypothetical protein